MMNNDLNHFIINLFNKGKFINEWLSYRYKEKPLYIYGKPGTGKTTVAKYILKDWVKIHIESDFCKSGKDFNEYISESLYKKSISMMFDTNSNVYKSLIIDDIAYIQNNDKKLFKSIVNFSKGHIKNHPIIYIFNTITNKTVQLIIKKCYPFHIDYTENQFIQITKRFLLKGKSFPNEKIKKLVQQSNYNLHNIIANIHFHNGVFQNIQKYDYIHEELHEHIRDLSKKSISEIYNNSYTEYNIIGLNILENCYSWIMKQKLKKKEKIELIDQLYELNHLSDKILSSIHEDNNWNLIDHIITLSIVNPILIIRSYNIDMLDLHYNKYISKCIISIHNAKVLTNNNLDIEILSFLYSMIFSYYNLHSDQLKKKITYYINYYNIPLNIVEKFLKYFIKDFNKTKIKIFYKL